VRLLEQFVAASAVTDDGEPVLLDAAVPQRGVDGGRQVGQSSAVEARLLVDDENDVSRARGVVLERFNLAGTDDFSVFQLAADALRRNKKIQAGKSALADVGGSRQK
jgi:hypothetical protein